MVIEYIDNDHNEHDGISRSFRNLFETNIAKLTEAERRMNGTVNKASISSGNGFSRFGANPLSKLMLVYIWLNHLEQVLLEFETKSTMLYTRKCF